MKFVFVILLFISSFQFSMSNRKHHYSDQKKLEKILEILKERLKTEATSFKSKNRDYHLQELNYKVDPNDHIDIDLWNELNKKDMENMPIIVNYSNEIDALHWLKWYLHIAQRYNQVR